MLSKTPSASEPLVSVITPVFNGAVYLDACIESVLAQTYSHWEYILVDNCSTDETLAVAKRYAATDPRIKIYANSQFLPQIANWNHALRRISPNSKYCKVLHADDWLFPECLREMVAVAEHHPSVGMVGAYRLQEERVDLDGLKYPSTIVPGREIGRRHLLRQGSYFGSPTSLLFRADLLRARREFYNEANPHADTEVCVDLMRHCDFGFVHQVLTFTRRHNEAETTRARHFNTFLPSGLYTLMRYGQDFLSPAELQEAVTARRRGYFWFLGRRMLAALAGRSRGRGFAFWMYHAKLLLALLRPRTAMGVPKIPLLPPSPKAAASNEGSNTPAVAARG